MKSPFLRPFHSPHTSNNPKMISKNDTADGFHKNSVLICTFGFLRRRVPTQRMAIRPYPFLVGITCRASAPADIQAQADNLDIINEEKFDMSRDEQLKRNWEELVKKLSAQFADGDPLELDAIIYLVGIQELGQFHRKFKKHHKLDLMHIAICRLLEPYGYYEFEFFDEEGWPHYTIKEELPPLKAGEQSVLMKEAIVGYFLEREYII